MGTKRVGLARTQALIQNLKRELTMGGSTLVGDKRKLLAKNCRLHMRRSRQWSNIDCESGSHYLNSVASRSE